MSITWYLTCYLTYINIYYTLLTLLTLHRDGSDIFSVNALHFHAYNTFASAGSDGIITYWDKDARHKLTSFEMFKRQCPVTDVKFNPMVR